MCTSATHAGPKHSHHRHRLPFTKWQLLSRPCFYNFQTSIFNKLDQKSTEKLLWFNFLFCFCFCFLRVYFLFDSDDRTMMLLCLGSPLMPYACAHTQSAFVTQINWPCSKACWPRPAAGWFPSCWRRHGAACGSRHHRWWGAGGRGRRCWRPARTGRCWRCGWSGGPSPPQSPSLSAGMTQGGWKTVGRRDESLKQRKWNWTTLGKTVKTVGHRDKSLKQETELNNSGEDSEDSRS